MFLFTTSDPRQNLKAPSGSASPQGGGSPIIEAIRQGARQTDTSFDYLVKTAQRESSLDPAAKAKTSSASGLFQFIEQTWLGIVKSDGDKHGLSDYAGAITERSGRFSVDDPQTKRDILALRHDPKVSSVMAGVLAQKNRETLMGALGREPSPADLYVAHVLGANGARALIRSAQNSPGQSAATQLPEAAAANRPIFYDRAGRARNSAEVYAVLAASHAASVEVPRALAQANVQSVADPAALKGKDVAALKPARDSQGLFSTQGSRGGVSDTVKKLWTTGPRREPVKLAANATGFFPRSMDDSGPAAVAETSDAEKVAAMAAVPEDAAERPSLLSLPLPPRRPLKLAGAADGRAAAARPSRLGGR